MIHNGFCGWSKENLSHQVARENGAPALQRCENDVNPVLFDIRCIFPNCMDRADGPRELSTSQLDCGDFPFDGGRASL